MSTEVMNYDVLIVGAGPAGLSAAIKLKQLSPETSICVLEKAAEVGGHILSGAVLEPRALNELFPNWQDLGAPVNVPVTAEEFLFLNEKKSWKMPQWLLPKQLTNHGNYIISLENLCRWLAEQAQNLGVEIYPGFTAAKLLFHEDGSVKGVATGDMGIAKDGSHRVEYAPGVEIHGKYTLIGEGCRGYLAEQLMQHFQLRQNKDPQTYGLGIKEIWQVTAEKHRPGFIQHTAGWPLTDDVYGGSFIYHLDNQQVAIGFVVGLDYQNPYLDPFKEMQRFKTHPAIRQLLEGGQRISYGARALNEGGYQAIPKLTFPGGLLIGCSAGFLNVLKIKGSHNAMKSGMLAAEAVAEALKTGSNGHDELHHYPELIKNSWIHEELYQARNFRPWFKFGLKIGTFLGGLELKLFKGKTPWTLHHHQEDRACTKTIKEEKIINYPKPDGVISFDRMSSVFLANIYHQEDQPIHLRLKDSAKAIEECYKNYDSPEQRYCPAGVYEIVKDEQNQPRLQINGANCVHCKTCDIKDPTDNIVWTPPEGGSGPNYSNM